MFFFYTFTFILLVSATALYLTRSYWRPHAPPIPYLTAPGPIPDFLYHLSQSLSDYIHSFRYTALPQSMNFADDAEAGLHSSNFNLAENIETGDSRRGLDEEGRREVHRLMKVRKVDFDEARRLWMEERFRREGIGADGRPLDRKAVVFS